jgi:5-methylcytosine-specific restriction endonuclease McrA
MSVIAAAIKHMLSAGMPHDAIVAAVAEMEAASTHVRTARSEDNFVRLPAKEWNARREQVFALKGRVCVYCGAEGTEVDHVIPRSRGGSHDERNLVPACKSCNSSKRDLLPQEWRP